MINSSSLPKTCFARYQSLFGLLLTLSYILLLESPLIAGASVTDKEKLADTWNERGRVASRENRLEAGVADFTKAIRLDPTHALYHANRGLMYGKMNRNEEALRDYDRAIELSPEAPSWHGQRSRVLVALKRFREAVDNCDVEIEILHQLAAACVCLSVTGSSVQLAIGGFVAQADDCDAQTEFAPEIAIAYGARAYANYSLGNRSSVIADLEMAVKIDPKSANLHAACGNAYAEVKENDKAIAEVNEALTLDPANELAYGVRANLNYQLGDTVAALVDYDKALALAPNNPRFYFERGNIHYQRGENDAAKADYNAALKLNPHYAEAYNNRSLLEGVQWTRTREGIRDLSKSIKFDPNNPVRYNERGLENLHAHKPDKALKAFNKAIYSSGAAAELIARRGAAFSQKGNQTQALVEFDKAIALDPNLAEAYFYRSLTYFVQERFDEALADLNRTIELAPDQPAPYFDRGEIQRKRKSYAEAIGDYTRCIEIGYPKMDLVYNSRGKAYEGWEKYDEAITDFDQAIKSKPTNVAALVNRGQLKKVLGQTKEGLADLNQALAANGGEPGNYNGAAWDMAVNADARFRDGKQAVRFATKACELGHWKDFGCLDTLAAAYAEAGDFQAAVRDETKALLLVDSKNRPTVDGMRERLGLYKKKEPYREQ